MRSGTLSVVVGVLLLAGPSSAQTLEQTAGPPGASLNGVTEHGGDVFASGRGGGAFVLSEGEWSFLPVQTRLSRLFSVGGTLFSSDGSSVYRSYDGESWDQVIEASIQDVSFTADSALVLTFDSLFISADGLEWRNVITGREVVDEEGMPTGQQLPGLRHAARTPDGKTWVTANAFSGIYFSEDGVTWQQASDGIPSVSISQELFALSTGILITYAGSEIYAFDHASETWVERPLELPEATSVRKFLEAQGELFALAQTPSTNTSWLYRFDGAAWTEIDLPAQLVGEVAASDDGLFAVTGGGLYEKVGDGAWEPQHEGLVASSASPFALSGDVVAGGSSGWMKTTDEGATWQPVDFPVSVIRIHETDGGVVVGMTGDGVFRSLDGGESWQPANIGIDVGPFHQKHFRDVASLDGVIYGGLHSSRAIKHGGGETKGDVYRSTDDGQSWALFGSGYPNNSQGLPAAVYRLGVTENVLFAQTEEGLLRIPHTGGAWEEVTLPTTGGVGGIASDGNRVVLTTLDDNLVSDDDGATWSTVTEGLPDGLFRKNLAEHDGEIHLLIHPIPALGTFESGLYTLGENAWVDTGVEIPTWVTWNSMIGQGEDLFLGSTNHGVWRVNNFIIGTDPPEEQTDVAALSIFPNPVQRNATLSLTLPSASDVQIGIFDVTGRRVSTIHAGELAAQSGHRFEIDASDLAPGVYVVRAEGDGVRLNRTITVVR